MQSAIDMARHYQGQLRKFQNGILEVEGEDLINKVAAHFMAAASVSFRALSNNDLEFWKGAESKPYYANNMKLIERDIWVERVFILPRSKFATELTRSVIRRQVADKIKVRIMAAEDAERYLSSRLDRDFGLHDKFAVSFFRNYYGRSFKVDVNRQTVDQYLARFDLVAQNSEWVPEKTHGDRTMFTEVNEFDRWFEHKALIARRPRRRATDAEVG